MDTLILIAVLLFALYMYLLPYFIARGRQHYDKTAIGLLALLLGWTGWGWIAALIWAFTGNTKKNKPIAE